MWYAISLITSWQLDPAVVDVIVTPPVWYEVSNHDRDRGLLSSLARDCVRLNVTSCGSIKAESKIVTLTSPVSAHQFTVGPAVV